jgi:hypothetical protein
MVLVCGMHSMHAHQCCLCCCLTVFVADPLSGQPLSSDQLVPNLVLRDMIHAWLQEDPSSDAHSNADSSTAPAAVATDSTAGTGDAVVSRSSSPSKGNKDLSSSRDSDGVRDAVPPCTPVRTWRDV